MDDAHVGLLIRCVSSLRLHPQNLSRRVALGVQTSDNEWDDVRLDGFVRLNT